MLNDRRMNVLSALVREYVASVQPVGSRVLVERYGLGCSSATVRSELSALEETGYVFQPHVSAGRVPTEAGYRVFVDEMIAEHRQGLDPAEALGVRQRYEEADHEIGDLLRETSTLLSQLTSYVAVVAAPTLRRARIRRLTLVPLGAHRALVVLVTDSGQVANRPIEFGTDVDAAVLAGVEASLAGALDGAVADVAATLRAGFSGASGLEAAVMLAVLDAVVELLAEADEDRVLTGGVSALLAHPEFSDPSVVRPLVGLLEDGLSLLKVLSDVMRSPYVQVRIGHENPSSALEHASFVAARYGDGDAGGIVGVIGPTRMDYGRAMGAVKTVADSLTDVI